MKTSTVLSCRSLWHSMADQLRVTGLSAHHSMGDRPHEVKVIR
jgi:hypothetical protein